MLERTLRAASVIACLLVLAGWTLFALDETRTASQASAAEVAGRAAARAPDPSPRQERAREAIHSRPRELIDDANDVLLAPFAGLVDGSSDRWVRRSVPMLLALVLYGFGLGYLARFARGRA